MVVEDTKSIIEELTAILGFEDYLVIQANNGSEGLRLAIIEIPDLIISDIMMPEVDGYKLREELSKNPATENIPFIFLTAETSNEELRKGMSMGADDYIIKPFTSDDITQAVRINLSKYERLKNINQEKVALLTDQLEKEKQLSQIDPVQLTGEVFLKKQK